MTQCLLPNIAPPVASAEVPVHAEVGVPGVGTVCLGADAGGSAHGADIDLHLGIVVATDFHGGNGGTDLLGCLTPCDAIGQVLDVVHDICHV